MYKFLFVLALAFVAISALPAENQAPKDLDTAQQFYYGSYGGYPYGYSAYGAYGGHAAYNPYYGYGGLHGLGYRYL